MSIVVTDAHEAYELASRLAERHIAAALFADNYAYKMEALEGSVVAPRILANGIEHVPNVCVCLIGTFSGRGGGDEV